MLRALYDWIIRLASHRRAEWVLAVVSFVESSVFPIPPDAMLVPLTLARPERAWRYALIATVTSVAGGVAGYYIGYYLFETLGQWILDFYGLSEQFVEFSIQFNRHGLAIVFFGGITPFPYKVITIASGVTQMSLPVFIAASIAARGLRFVLVCGLLWYFGEPMKAFIERYLGWLTLAGGVALVGGFVVARYMM